MLRSMQVSALSKMAAAKGFAIDFTEDASQFVTANLKQYNAVVFIQQAMC